MIPASEPALGVLIVDGSQDTREVLRAVLERRGLHIWETSEAAKGLELARAHHPRVIILDLETADGQRLRAEYDAQSATEQAHLVVLGEWSRPDDGRQSVAKPYHYGPLIRTIEQLAAR